MITSEIVDQFFEYVNTSVWFIRKRDFYELESEVKDYIKTFTQYIFAPVQITYNTDTEEYIATLTYYTRRKKNFGYLFQLADERKTD